MSRTRRGAGSRSLLWLVACVALLLMALVLIKPPGFFETGSVTRASYPPPERAEELRPAGAAERTGALRESVLEPTEAVVPEVAEVEAESSLLSAQTRFVDEQGAPIAGVEFGVTTDPSFVVRSGSDGVARLEMSASLLPSASRTLVFEARCIGFARDSRSAEARPGKTLLLGDWELVPGGNVEGVVLDENGRGLARIEVACLKDLREADWERSRRDALQGLWRPAARTVTGSDGSFVLEAAPAGRIRLVAVADDRPAARSDVVDVPPGGSARGVTIHMDPSDGGTTIAGIVLDPLRTPVPYAELKIAASGASYGISADEEGRFSQRLNDREPCDVTAQDPERRYREAIRRGVMPGTKDLVLELARAPELQLLVSSRDGAPIERFAVATIAARDAGVLAFLREAERPQGLAVLAVPAQSFHVEVRANGWMPARLGPFTAEAPPARLDCRLDPAGGVRGVVAAGGQLVSGATVGLYHAVKTNDTCNGFPVRTKTRPALETESEEHGAFSLSVEEAGTYYLRAVAEGYAPAELGPLELSPANQREVRIELGHGGTLDVRVRSAKGASVAGQLVAISRGDGRARTERTDERGIVVFSRLTPGAWQVVLAEEEIDPDYGATYFGTKSAGEIPANCRVFEGETTRVDLWLEAEDEGDCQLAGRLVIDGKPAEGWLASLDQEGDTAAEARAFDEPGSFRVAVDEPGSYRLSLRPDTNEPSAMLAIFDSLELYEGTRFWSLELRTGTLEGTLGAAGGEDELVFYRWERGSVQCFAPLVPGEAGRFRCSRAPAGRGALVRCDPSVPLEEQTPIVLRELTVEAGQTLAVEL